MTYLLDLIQILTVIVYGIILKLKIIINKK